MGIWILEGELEGGNDAAVMVDSVTGIAFGHTFADREEAESFIAYVQDKTGKDPRALTSEQCDDAHTRWLEHQAFADKVCA